MSLVGLKAIFSLAVFMAGALGVLLPSALGRGAPGQRFMARGDTLAGGMLAGAGLVHLLSGGGRASFVWMRITAISVFGSSPTSLAAYLFPSDSCTSIFVAPPATWLLVRICPWGPSMTMPEPSPTVSCLNFLGIFLSPKNWRKRGSFCNGREGLAISLRKLVR